MVRLLLAVAVLGAAGAVWALWARPNTAPHGSLEVAEGAVDATTHEAPLTPPPRRPILRAWRPPQERTDEAPDLRRPRHVPPATLETLGTARGWEASVKAFHGLPTCRDDEAASRLLRLLDEVTDPVVRQNLLFHLALGVRGGAAHLEDLRRRAGPRWSDADDEDALVALAFGGQGTAVGEMTALAVQPSSAPVHRLLPQMSDLEALGKTGSEEAREVLRSHHAIEVLDREPYYKLLAVHVPLVWQDAAPSPAVAAHVRTKLCEVWLDRYPGHPGSDDIALRVARSRLAEGRNLEAARWYGKAAALPDQDAGVRWAAAGGLVGLAEVLLEREEVLTLANELAHDTPQHELLHYIYVRRTAAEVGVREGVEALELAIRRADVPQLEAAFHHSCRPQGIRGLDSGRTPLPEDDELRSCWGPGGDRMWPLVPHDDARGRDRRLEPSRETVSLDPYLLARQVRIWRSLALLQDRAWHARRHEREDLEYKLAAVPYHEPNAWWPAYHRRGSEFGRWLGEAWRRDRGPFEQGAERFMATSLAWRRALEAFGRFVDENPDSDLVEKARFSMGLCWRCLADEAPRHLVTSRELDRARRREAVEGVLACMQDVTRRHPQSPLADDAARAVVYWTSWREREAQQAGASDGGR
ncbi:MAG: hypothetical protein AB7T63_11730 [Planctomycetota bacterium]